MTLCPQERSGLCCSDTETSKFFGRAGQWADHAVRAERRQAHGEGLIPEAYAPFAQRVFAAFTEQTAVTNESDVAEAVWQAAQDESGQLRFPAGADAVALAMSK